MAQPQRETAQESLAPDGRRYPIPDARALRREFDQLAVSAAEARAQGQQIVVVQGLGFVGSAVAAVIADARDDSDHCRYLVIGVDLPSAESYWKVGMIRAGECPIRSPDVDLERLIAEGVRERGNLRATATELAYSLADVIVVDVPLSVDQRVAARPADISIDMRGFSNAIRCVGRQMRGDALVLVETTVPAGCCEKVVRPLLEKERRARGIDAPLLLAHSYERVMPGPRYVDSIRRFWRTFAGIDEASAARARQFLSSFIHTGDFALAEQCDTTGSELGKLLENSYRAVNIALIHEWTLLAEKMEVNLFEVIEAIGVRKGTHDNIRLPGFGVGGYCLTKDSLLAQWAGHNLFQSDVTLHLTLRALQTNFEMPLHSLNLLESLSGLSPLSGLSSLSGLSPLSGRKTLVCGVAYLAGVADTRNSPAELLVERLIAAGADVLVHDPCMVGWPEMPHITVSNDLADCLARADCVVMAVPHPEYLALTADEYTSGFTRSPAIVDAQNIIHDQKARQLYDAGCQLAGVGKGHWRKRGFQCQS